MENKETIESVKPQKTKKQKTFFILKIIGNVVFYIIIIALFIFAIANIRSGGKGGIPNIFGSGYLAVETDSMKKYSSETVKDPMEKMTEEYKNQYNSYAIQSFTKSDMVTVNMLDDNAKKTGLRVGDVVVYKNSTLKGMTPTMNVAHRIVYVYFTDGTGTTSNNEELYKGKEVAYVTTQGDYAVTQNIAALNYTSEQAICQGILWENESEKNGTKAITQWENVQLAQIQAKVSGVWYGFGQTIRDMQANFFWIFVLPVLIVLVIEIFFVIKNILDYRAEKKKAAGLDGDAQTFDVEAEKARIKAELMAELALEQEKKAKEEAALTEEKNQEIKDENVEEQEDIIEETNETIEENNDETPSDEEQEETIEEDKENKDTSEDSDN